jgi:hypothetical protein
MNLNLFNSAASGIALAAALTALAGCSGNMALVGRDTLPARTSQPVQNEIVGTVDRVDAGFNEIYLSASPGHPRMVTYSAETRVMYLGKAYSVSQLRSGDMVSMQMEKQDSRGNPHTHRISIQKSNGDWFQRQN